MTARRWTLAILVIAAMAAMTGLLARPSSAAQAGDEPRIVVILEQNHTYDSYFGMYPRGDGYPGRRPPTNPDPAGVPVQGAPLTDELARTFRPAAGAEVMSNGGLATQEAISAGAMDGFVTAQVRRGFNGSLPMHFATRDTNPGLWRMADEYVVFDRYFSSAPGGSLVNMLYLLTGSAHGVTEGTKESLAAISGGSVPTVFDRLSAAGVEWKFYAGRLDDISGGAVVDGSYFTPEITTPSALYWAPILAMERFWTDPRLNENLEDQGEFYEDAAVGDLPAVSFVLPLPTDHPITGSVSSERRLVSLVNALVKGPDWKRTTAFIVWDDWGGFYDHVAPPTVGGEQLGVRLPALLVSPQAKRGHTSSVPYDHTSILRFIERSFGLEPLPGRTSMSSDFSDAVDDGAERRSLIRLGSLPDAPVGTTEQNAGLLRLYAGGGALALVVAVAARRSRRA